VVVDLHGELLGAAEVRPIGDAVLLLQVADFFGEGATFWAPWNEDGVGVAVDETEFLGGGLE
jgi:hypothetical protein